MQSYMLQKKSYKNQMWDEHATPISCPNMLKTNQTTIYRYMDVDGPIM